ncbi:N-acetyltransferase [Salmonella enterica subsp. enterica serovar Choleraesuis]|nr:N-acetyltransferase [Salmonella enterica subsp. enterica serovar Choleraesuis]
MNIFQAQPQDVSKILPLYLAYREFYQVDIAPQAAEEFLRNRITLKESTVYYVQDDSGKVLGFAQLYPLFCSLEMKRIWLLYDLFVVPEARKQGVAQRLLARADELAKETQSGFVMLSTATDNTKAQALYESQGYVRDEAFYSYVKMTK